MTLLKDSQIESEYKKLLSPFSNKSTTVRISRRLSKKKIIQEVIQEVIIQQIS
jgi:hypothetical protein